MNSTNPLTDILAAVVSLLLAISGGVLTYAGKIDFTQATFLFTLAAGLFGGHLALKAPSPSQQQGLRQLVSDLAGALPTFLQHTHPPVPLPPATPAPPQPVSIAPTAVQTMAPPAPPALELPAVPPLTP